MSFAKVLPRRWVHQKPTGRKAIALPPSVELRLFVFVGRTEAKRGEGKRKKKGKQKEKKGKAGKEVGWGWGIAPLQASPAARTRS